MLLTVDRIESAGPDRRARRLVFSDGSTRLTAAAVLRQLCVEEGACVEPDFVECLLEPAERVQARERALRLVSYRERSAHEVHRRLCDDGYPSQVASEIVGRFTELALVNDTRFAEMWTRSRVASGYGSRRIARELTDKGVPEDIVRAVMELSADDELVRAKEALRGRSPRDRHEKERMVRTLVARGFSLRCALEAVGQPVGSDADEEPFIG